MIAANFAVASAKLAGMLPLLLACRPDPEPEPIETPDLVEALSDDEARAGIVTDEAALFGGISAEGQAGDIKLYNSRVQFIIQSVRPSGYYVEYGGGIIDADVIRPEGQPGRDVIDEFHVMAGVGRLMDAELAMQMEKLWAPPSVQMLERMTAVPSVLVLQM